MTRKPLGQIAYESIFKSRRVPHPTTNYPAAWDVVAKAVERAIRRREKILYKKLRSSQWTFHEKGGA
jgi:hypothetical protein